MSDLTCLRDYGLQKTLDQYYEKKRKPRLRIGLSEIGHPCHRWLWLRHYGYIPIPPEGRMLRLFQFGNLIEAQMIADLRASKPDWMIYGEQALVEISYNGITLRGSADCIISGITQKEHLGEIKSASDKKYQELIKKGYEEWSPKYKAQIHAYMLGLGLERTLAIVENKNDSSVYSERIKLDKPYIITLLENVFSTLSRPLEYADTTCSDADEYSARYCDYRGECFGKV